MDIIRVQNHFRGPQTLGDYLELVGGNRTALWGFRQGVILFDALQRCLDFVVLWPLSGSRLVLPGRLVSFIRAFITVFKVLVFASLALKIILFINGLWSLLVLLEFTHVSLRRVFVSIIQFVWTTGKCILLWWGASSCLLLIHILCSKNSRFDI